MWRCVVLLIANLAFMMASLRPAVAMRVPKLTLNDGKEIPALALGTYLGYHTEKSNQTTFFREVVEKALEVGQRHFDTAPIYQTESEIGEAIRAKIEKGEIKRDDVFITTKLWNDHHKKDDVIVALNDSLSRLGMRYVDLYLMHWPMAVYPGAKREYPKTDIMETWQGMEQARNLGLTRSIGICNFNQQQLQKLLNEATVKPAVLQIEVHIQLIQKELVDFAQAQGLVVMGYSPFGSVAMKQPGPGLNDPKLVKIAQKYGKTTAQVILRWAVQRNIIPIAKTVKLKRLEENMNIFDFNITREEMAVLESFNVNRRFTLPSFWQDHHDYPFEKVEDPIPYPFE